MIHATEGQKHHLQCLFTIVMTLAYQDHVSSQQLNKRWKAMQEEFSELYRELYDPTPADINTAWNLIKKAIDKGLKLETTIEKINGIIIHTKSDRLSALLVLTMVAALVEYEKFP